MITNCYCNPIMILLATLRAVKNINLFLTLQYPVETFQLSVKYGKLLIFIPPDCISKPCSSLFYFRLLTWRPNLFFPGFLNSLQQQKKSSINKTKMTNYLLANHLTSASIQSFLWNILGHLYQSLHFVFSFIQFSSVVLLLFCPPYCIFPLVLSFNVKPRLQAFLVKPASAETRGLKPSTIHTHTHVPPPTPCIVFGPACHLPQSRTRTR